MKAVIVAIAVIFAMPVSSLAGQVTSPKGAIHCKFGSSKVVNIQVNAQNQGKGLTAQAAK